MPHKWTEEDEAKLAEAVEACLPMQENMQEAREVWWAAVVGRMGLVDVTPEAARTRWQRLQNGEAKKVPEAWDRLAERVDEYEQSLLEATAGDVADIRRKVGELHAWFKKEWME